MATSTKPVPDFTFSAGAPGPGPPAPQQEGRPGCLRHAAIPVLSRHGKGTGLEQHLPGSDPFRPRRGLCPGGRRSLSNVRRRLSPELDVNVREKRDGLNGLVLWQALEDDVARRDLRRSRIRLRRCRVSRDEHLPRLLNRERGFCRLRHLHPAEPENEAFRGRAIRNLHVHGDGCRPTGTRRATAIFGGVEFIPRTGEVCQRIGHPRAASAWDTCVSTSIDPGVPDGSGFAGEADVSFEFLKKDDGAAFFSRGFQFSDLFRGQSITCRRPTAAGYAAHLSRRATLSYDFSYRTNRLSRETRASQASNNRLLTHTFSLDLRLARHLDVTLLGHARRRGRDMAAEPVRNRNFFGFSLIYGFRGSRDVGPGRRTVAMIRRPSGWTGRLKAYIMTDERDAHESDSHR